MKAEVKEIKEHVARAKAHVTKHDVVRTLDALIDALTGLSKAKQMYGREKFEVEILIDEVLRTLSAQSHMKNLFPKGLTFKRGQEKNLLATLTKLRDRINSAIEKAEQEKMRAYKLSIDEAVLGAQKLLDEGSQDEARRAFRKAADKFADEPGLLQDVGSRLLRGRLVQESVEYLNAAIEQDPRDPRPYTHLVNALEHLGELERAEDVTKNALRNFGPNDRTYTILARIHMKKKEWDEAYDMAQAAMDINPFASEAEKIAKQVKPRIFGRDKNGQSKEKKTYTFDL
ncbi:hypothetical protein [Desulfohalovibrio reitneri]|uniref:hypothetical protein n=1 Tax=Desulfohalovibrio reitneri TaxID=1307759 RepID=UPI0004A76F87|nr:hypothetical protein [Desulfohalovibrio reitneri]